MTSFHLLEAESSSNQRDIQGRYRGTCFEQKDMTQSLNESRERLREMRDNPPKHMRKEVNL